MQINLWRTAQEAVISRIAVLGVNRLFKSKVKITLDSLQSITGVLGAKAFDVEEQIRNDERSGNKRRKTEVHHWLGRVEKISKDVQALLDARCTDGGCITKLYKSVECLTEEARHFGGLVLDHNATGLRLPVEKLVGKQFEDNVDKILQLLLGGKVRSIAIYGMAGIGKTELAKHINNKLLERPQEYWVVWIEITEVFTIAMLQDEIAKALGYNFSNELNETKRSGRLNAALSNTGMNVVFILDGVWGCIDLKKLGDLLSVDCCRLLITTREEEAHRYIGCEKVIELEKLKEDEAFVLFKEKLGQESNPNLMRDKIAKSMVELCDGLPLGIIFFAKRMKGVTDIHIWNDTLAQLREPTTRHKSMEERVFKVLRRSFDRLEPNEGEHKGHSMEQRCFLYISFYSKGHKIDREELVRKFILQGFLEKRDSRGAQSTQGHAILKKLVECGLLESDNHDQVRMHNLVRLMALKINEGKSMVLGGPNSLKEIPKGEEWTKDLEQISLRNNGITTIPDGMSPNCPRLGTLLLDGNPLESIPESFFQRISGLRCLELSGTNIKNLPDSLSDMESLEVLLCMECDKLEHIPCLGKLKELREVDFTSSALAVVPHGMEKLNKLTFLSFHNAIKLEEWPSGLLPNLPDLQCLYLPYHVQVSGVEVAGLKHLEEFCGRVKDATNFQLITRRETLAYSIEVRSGFKHSRLDEFRGYNQLILSKFDFTRMDDQSIFVLAKGNVLHLNLRECEGLPDCLVETLRQLKNPRCLESLKVDNCQEIKCLWSREELLFLVGPVASTSASPPSAQAVFQSLREVEILYCNKIQKLGFSPSDLPCLEEIRIASCEEIKEIIQVGQDDGSTVSFPRLKSLFLYDLPSLLSICSKPMVCISMERITLYQCQTLKKMPLNFEESSSNSTLSTLPRIYLREEEMEWWRSLDLGHPTHHQLLHHLIQYL